MTEQVHATQQQIDDLQTTLMACVFSLDRPPSGILGVATFERAARLAHELAWCTLPGGGRAKSNRLNGMHHGWDQMGAGEDEGEGVLTRLLGVPPNEYYGNER